MGPSSLADWLDECTSKVEEKITKRVYEHFKATQPLTLHDLKAKVAEIYELRHIPFVEGILG